MAKEYIEREAAIKEAIAERDLHSPLTSELCGWRVGAEKVANRLASIPASDVVEVVRCRECFYNAGESRDLEGNPVILCVSAVKHEPDWYCASGKRKDGGQDE